ncbi:MULTISPECIES: DUF6770 family protein [Flavobacterium]|uniref:Uncharacterized protein n=1 Tax=Flavobacterium hankyongi TaxID=1176532 RepID=A0ABP8ZLM8_9FLAO|nr:DUF6770 family protein [Flavobacterium sp. N1846]
MKPSKILSLLICLIGITAFGQVTKLSNLSSNKYLDSRIIFEENKEDVYGYFVLYEKDRTDKKEFLLEYYVLDKNLNKIASGNFSHHKNTSMFYNTEVILRSVIRNNNKILISTGEFVGKALGMTYNMKFGTLYRELDLNDFSMSPSFLYLDFVKYELTEYSRKSTGNTKVLTQNLISANGNGFVMFQSDTRKDMALGIRTKPLEFRFYDTDKNQKWVHSFNTEKSKQFVDYGYLTADQNNLVLLKASTENNFLRIEVFDSNNGKLKAQLPENDNQKLIRIHNVQIQDNLLICLGELNSDGKNVDPEGQKTLGLMKLVYDLESGKTISQRYFNRDDPDNKIKLSSEGGVNSNGIFEYIDFKIKSDGGIVVLAEENLFDNSGEVNLCVIEFDSNMKVKYFEKVEKNKASEPNNKKYRDFEYQYSQKLEKDSYVFCYVDTYASKPKEKRDWFLGVITYVDGKYGFDKVSLKTSDGKIHPVLAKKGYVMLVEEKTDSKESEIRLEKINY